MWRIGNELRLGRRAISLDFYFLTRATGVSRSATDRPDSHDFTCRAVKAFRLSCF
jgi:hypothetical protein